MEEGKKLPEIMKVVEAGPFKPDWDGFRDYKIPQWYKNAKFGIFIHWGVYSVPAAYDEWYPRRMYLEGEDVYNYHRDTYGPQDKFGYKDFIPMFKAEKFDAADWVKLFKDAGAKYVVPVAEHHDGFAMYDCPFNRWKAPAMGPKRNIVAELQEETLKAGLHFGASTHRAEHCWFFSGGKKFDCDVQDPEFADLYGPAIKHEIMNPDGTNEMPDEDFLIEWLVRTCALVDLHQPEIVWFDWWIMERAYQKYLMLFAAYYYNQAQARGQEVAINFKHEAYAGDAGVFDVERGQLAGIRPVFWQTDTSVSFNSWSHINGHKYRTAKSLVHDLIDIVSKNGSLLLNIGPKADGTIPGTERELLLEIGKWLEINGEAIYDTVIWKTFGEGETKVTEGMFAEKHRKDFNHEDIRFTYNDGALYAMFLGWPEDGKLKIKTLASESTHGLDNIDNIELLGSNEKIQWSKDKEAMTVTLPKTAPCKHACTLKITGCFC